MLARYGSTRLTDRSPPALYPVPSGRGTMTRCNLHRAPFDRESSHVTLTHESTRDGPTDQALSHTFKGSEAAGWRTLLANCHSNPGPHAQPVPLCFHHGTRETNASVTRTPDSEEVNDAVVGV